MTGPHWQKDVTALTAAFRAGEADPREVVAECLARIARIDPALNAFVALSPTAEADAVESARRLARGEPRGPLEGVPLAIKDNLVVAGMPATWGSRVFAGEVRGADELPVARLRTAGAVLIGKANTPEFAVEGYTGNALFGVTGNPWNPALTPGGSSGGPVAAVAAGLVPAAIGTDGGGSIRRPAAYTGLCGLKPTIGRVPRAGGLPQVLLDFEVAGPLTRSVRDLRLILDVLAGPAREDPRTRLMPAEPPDAPGDRLRILYVERFGEAPCDPAILAACARAADRLAALGHEVARGAPPFDLAPANEAWPVIVETGLAHLARSVPQFAHEANEKYVTMAGRGASVPASELVARLADIAALRADVSAAFADFDVVMTPSCAAMPWPAGEPFPPVIDGQKVGPRGHAVYTGWVNACGHPAVALPAEPAPDGMPIGFQLVGDLAAESLLLDLAAAYEASLGPHAWPPIALG